jgi:hypothetical protein
MVMQEPPADRSGDLLVLTHFERDLGRRHLSARRGAVFPLEPATHGSEAPERVLADGRRDLQPD